MSERRTKLEQTIYTAAKEGAREMMHLERAGKETNHYRAMEDLLRNYPRVKRLEEHPEEYGFFPVGKSKDISVAPPPGSGAVDKVEAAELYVESRKRSYVRTLDRHAEVTAAVKMFEKRPEFIVIRMYYFGEDEYGNDRGEGAKRYTWEEIAEALEHVGISRSVSVLRGWRSNIVREMTVQVFGIDGAISIESRENTRQMKRWHDDEEE